MREMLRGLWLWVKRTVEDLTERAADEMASGDEPTVGQRFTRRVASVLAGGVGVAVMFLPWVSPKFTMTLADEFFRLSTLLWSMNVPSVPGYQEGV